MGAAAAASPRQQETFSAKSCRRGTAGSQPRGGPGRAGLRVSVSTLQRPAGSRREEPHREIPTAAALLCVCVCVSATPPGQCHGADNPWDPRPPVPPPPRVHAPGWLPRLRAALPTKRGETPTPRDRPSREGGGGGGGSRGRNSYFSPRAKHSAHRPEGAGSRADRVRTDKGGTGLYLDATLSRSLRHLSGGKRRSPAGRAGAGGREVLGLSPLSALLPDPARLLKGKLPSPPPPSPGGERGPQSCPGRLKEGGRTRTPRRRSPLLSAAAAATPLRARDRSRSSLPPPPLPTRPPTPSPARARARAPGLRV